LGMSLVRKGFTRFTLTCIASLVLSMSSGDCIFNPDKSLTDARSLSP
jgi:hypothetical protein